MTLSEELQWRGFVNQSTFDDITELDKKTRTFYFGVDPSADSMQIGNLAAAMMCRIFMKHGYKAVLLVGGATGLIGDPDGKKQERDLKTPEQIDKNKRAIAAQYKQIFQEDFTLVDNADWFKGINYIEFLRDVGKHVPMRVMVNREFVQSRLSEEGEGISYAEFSYSLIQGYDFVHLFKEYGVTLQVSGADQWGNMIAGVDLVRRMEGGTVDAFTVPLIVNKATGMKFGKSEEGAIWLDETKTSVYRFYQFWLNVDDEGVESYLKVYTELEKPQIDEIIARFHQNQAERYAQKQLAYEVTKIVHGQENADSVIKVTELLFGKQNADDINANEIRLLKNELPTAELPEKSGLVDALVSVGFSTSKSETRRLLEQGAIKLNGEKITEDRELTTQDAQLSGWILLQKGKNAFALLNVK